ncbi:hypothetical protein HMPREF0083_02487 [Aneurinibacillus aneurinilyticus ATCC 12856]|uniref:Uncharacterized protein n=1 Tax=Aneurinibacillus aneurinilyticus ATCC 12856 TaxID=649747 RepID=U1YF69_ANEAE|nr:hypothetical protein HMPREF0083_02487 [Aneurinibacillus aneurinilyticus ATCC 12856]
MIRVMFVSSKERDLFGTGWTYFKRHHQVQNKKYHNMGGRIVVFNIGYMIVL